MRTVVRSSGKGVREALEDGSRRFPLRIAEARDNAKTPKAQSLVQGIVNSQASKGRGQEEEEGKALVFLEGDYIRNHWVMAPAHGFNGFASAVALGALRHRGGSARRPSGGQRRCVLFHCSLPNHPPYAHNPTLDLGFPLTQAPCLIPSLGPLRACRFTTLRLASSSGTEKAWYGFRFASHFLEELRSVVGLLRDGSPSRCSSMAGLKWRREGRYRAHWELHRA